MRPFAAARAGLIEVASLDEAERIIQAVVFLRLAEARGLEREGAAAAVLGRGRGVGRAVMDWIAGAAERYEEWPFLVEGRLPDARIGDAAMGPLAAAMAGVDAGDRSLPGALHEQHVATRVRRIGRGVVVERAGARRRERGAWYTSPSVARSVVGAAIDAAGGRGPLVVIDPACGAGVFLVEALARIAPGSMEPSARAEAAVGALRGVDVDGEAVSLARLAVLLEVGAARAARPATIAREVRSLLAALRIHLRVGDALLGVNLDGVAPLPGRLGALDLRAAFAGDSARGGFDVVLGNPPFGAKLDEDARAALRAAYSMVAGHESAAYFVARAAGMVREGGVMAMLVPQSSLQSVRGARLRGFLSERFERAGERDFAALPVFRDALAPSVAPILVKRHVPIAAPATAVAASGGRVIPLGTIASVSQGLIAYDARRHARSIITRRAFHADRAIDASYGPELRGSDVTRYAVRVPGGRFLRWGAHLARPRRAELFAGPRLLFREITCPRTGRIHVACTEEACYFGPPIIGVVHRLEVAYSLHFLLAVCASGVMAEHHLRVSPKARRRFFPRILVGDVRALPIPAIDFEDAAERAEHDAIAGLAQQLSTLRVTLDEQDPEAARIDALIEARVRALYAR